MNITDTGLEQKLEEIRNEGALYIANMNKMVDEGLKEIEELKTSIHVIVAKAQAQNDADEIHEECEHGAMALDYCQDCEATNEISQGKTKQETNAMWTLSDESISMMKKDAKLNHISGIRNYDLYRELAENMADKSKLGHIIVSAQKDFENAMNIYGTIALYRESFSHYQVSRSFYLKMEKIWQEIKHKKCVTSDEV